MKTLGWLVECEGRSLFMRQAEDVQWAAEDNNYKVTELVGKVEQSTALKECEEARQLLTELYALQEEEILMLHERIKELEK